MLDGCGGEGTLLRCCWECKFVQPLWRTEWSFLNKLRIQLPYDMVIHITIWIMVIIPLLGIYLEKTLIWKDTYTPMLITALFTIVKTWKQPKCPSTDEWIKMWYIHNRILLSLKKEWNNVICSTMHGPRDDHTKWNIVRERQ